MADFDEKLRALLKSNNYVLGRRLGEGYFREVYEVVHSKGPLRKKLVAKVNHGKEKDSVQHHINLAKGNLHVRELETLNTLQHPNIIQIYDLLEDHNRFVVVEEHFDAVSLEDKVRVQGPISNKDFFQAIFSQVAGALRYLHVDRKMLHRDIKPSNILVGRQADLAKLIDFQNAAFYGEIESKLLPTRGGTDYTHPDLLNGLLTQWPTNASIASEFYALGATMFYALTGRSPFDYRLVNADNGIPLEIGNETKHIALLLGEERLPNITADVHEDLLEEKLKFLSAQYRDLVRGCLSLQDKAYTSLDAKEAHTKFGKDFKEAMKREAEFPRPFEAMIQRELQLLQETKQPYFVHDDGEISTIEKTVNVVKQYGKRGLTSDVSSSGIGSDAEYKAINEEKYVLADETVRMELCDRVDHYSYGTWSPGWEETYSRYLTIQLDGKTIIQAERRLERESGNLHEDFGKQGALPWYVVKVEKPEELMKIPMNSYYVEDFGRVETILEILQRDDVQWRKAEASDMHVSYISVPPEKAYRATINGILVTARVLPEQIEREIFKDGKAILLQEHCRLVQEHGVRKTSLRDYRALLFPHPHQEGIFVLEYGIEGTAGSYVYDGNDKISPDAIERIKTLYASVEQRFL